jgi:hypothetical protein
MIQTRPDPSERRVRKNETRILSVLSPIRSFGPVHSGTTHLYVIHALVEGGRERKKRNFQKEGFCKEMQCDFLKKPNRGIVIRTL